MRKAVVAILIAVVGVAAVVVVSAMMGHRGHLGSAEEALEAGDLVLALKEADEAAGLGVSKSTRTELRTKIGMAVLAKGDAALEAEKWERAREAYKFALDRIPEVSGEAGARMSNLDRQARSESDRLRTEAERLLDVGEYDDALAMLDGMPAVLPESKPEAESLRRMVVEERDNAKEIERKAVEARTRAEERRVLAEEKYHSLAVEVEELLKAGEFRRIDDKIVEIREVLSDSPGSKAEASELRDRVARERDETHGSLRSKLVELVKAEEFDRTEAVLVRIQEVLPDSPASVAEVGSLRQMVFEKREEAKERERKRLAREKFDRLLAEEVQLLEAEEFDAAEAKLDEMRAAVPEFQAEVDRLRGIVVEKREEAMGRAPEELAREKPDRLVPKERQPLEAPGATVLTHKSRRKAFFLSLLVPGLGQRYLGQHRRSQIYMGAEAGVWAAVATFYVQGSMREDRYREYSQIVGGADPNVDDDEYYKNLALYSSSDIFATVIRWEARALYPDDANARGRYYAENVYPSDKAWSWPDEEAFDEYKRLRRRSKHAYRTAVNVIGLSVLNRLVSAIDTVTGREAVEFAGGVRPVFSMKNLPGDDSATPFLFLSRSF